MLQIPVARLPRSLGRSFGFCCFLLVTALCAKTPQASHAFSYPQPGWHAKGLGWNVREQKRRMECTNGLMRASETDAKTLSQWQKTWKASLSLLGGVTFGLGIYLLFFKATSMITAMVSGSPELEIISFVALSLIPLILVQQGGAVNPRSPLLNRAFRVAFFCIPHLCSSVGFQ